MRETKREGGREGEREGGREGVREERKEAVRERERELQTPHNRRSDYTDTVCTCTTTIAWHKWKCLEL